MKILTLITIIAFVLFMGCKEAPLPPIVVGPDNGTDRIEAPALIQDINQFIKLGMEDAYLWYNTLPDIDIRYEYDSFKYFDKLLYEEDRWSYVTDDRQALENSFHGIEKTYGWSLAFGRFTNTNSLFALIEFVYPNTPASEKGLKRGDIIVEISGGDITEENYRDLLSGDQLTFTLGIAGEDGISTGSVMSLESKELNLNPVLFTNIIEHDGHKIGYLFYAQFISDFNSSLDSVFQRFKEEQVTDIILDLRYNPGGGTNAAQYLCSSLAPLNVVRNSRTLVSFMWNDKYMDYFESVNSKEDLGIQFSLAVAHKMDLSRLTILTGRGTASASELTITGLKPYMDITTIGETTYGKYTASVTLKPEYYYDRSSDYAEFKNWGIQPIVLRYANSLGETDFKDGFTPDIYVKDELINALPLGQKEEPLLKKAIEHLTGSPVVAMKRATIETKYSLFDRGFSRFDKNKMELLYEGFDSPGLK